MKDEKKNRTEPFRPEDTPTPPQQIDPIKRNENSKRAPTGKNNSNSKPEPNAPKQKLLGDETEITDETTI